MNKTFDYEVLRAQLDSEYRVAECEARIAEIRKQFRMDEYSSKLAGIDLVRDMLNQQNGNGHRQRLEIPDKKQEAGNATQRAMVVAIIPDLPEGNFTRIEIAACVERRYPGRGGDNLNRGTLRNTLAGLVEDGILEVAEEAIPGSQKPTVYRRGPKYRPTTSYHEIV